MDFTDVPRAPTPAYQNLAEFGQLWEHVAARPHARVLEIGSLFGGTLWYWSHLPKIELLVTIDMPSDWPPIAAGVREAREHWHEWVDERVGLVNLVADSQAPETRDAVALMMSGELFDFAFIDGDHGYEGVRADWLAWSPLVRPGGVVAFHDTSMHGTSVESGVVRWVDELRHHLPSIEWTDPDGVGIAAFTLP